VAIYLFDLPYAMTLLRFFTGRRSGKCPTQSGDIYTHMYKFSKASSLLNLPYAMTVLRISTGRRRRECPTQGGGGSSRYGF